MNKKLAKGVLAGVATLALAAGGTTFAAFSDFGNINNNTVGAGFLRLDLGENGTGNASLDWGQLAPNNIHSTRTIWVASNDGLSVPNANLKVTFHNLSDQENGCSSNGELAADPTCGTAGDPGE
ncbi:MAG: TasA family protein, partial [Nocardioidaceae bacterium]